MTDQQERAAKLFLDGVWWQYTRTTGATIMDTREFELAEAAAARAALQARATIPQGMRMVPVEPICGPEYDAGNWSRRNWEAALRDQGAPLPELLCMACHEPLSVCRAFGPEVCKKKLRAIAAAPQQPTE